MLGCVVHARCILNSNRKYVPKLLKDLGKKQHILKADLDFLGSVKDAVIGKETIGDARAERLRQMVNHCMGGD